MQTGAVPGCGVSPLLFFGFGYTAKALVQLLQGGRLFATVRGAEEAATCARYKVRPIQWGAVPEPAWIDGLRVLISTPPTKDGGDPVLQIYEDWLCAHADRIGWVGYISATSVYGDRAGGWVDEATRPAPTTERGRARLMAERAWQAIPGLPLHIFRPGSIYGPERGPVARLMAGKGRRIVKPGQYFSRIHVDDLAQVLCASMTAPAPGAIYNVCDDDPAPSAEVVHYAADQLDLPLPPATNFDCAALSQVERSFFAESKRVRNDKIKTELGIRLIYPDFRHAIAPQPTGRLRQAVASL